MLASARIHTNADSSWLWLIPRACFWAYPHALVLRMSPLPIAPPTTPLCVLMTYYGLSGVARLLSSTPPNPTHWLPLLAGSALAVGAATTYGYVAPRITLITPNVPDYATRHPPTTCHTPAMRHLLYALHAWTYPGRFLS